MKRFLLVLCLGFFISLFACDLETVNDEGEPIDALDAWFKPIFEARPNLTASIKVESEDPDMPQPEIDIMISSDKEYLLSKAEDDIEELYVVISDDKATMYMYNFDQSRWLSQPVSLDQTVLEMILDSFFEKPLESTWFDVENDKYILSEHHYEDVFGDDDVEEIDCFEIDLSDDMMTIIISGEEDGFENVITLTFYDKGTTTIELPDFYEGEGESIPELDVWFEPIYIGRNNISATMTVSSDDPEISPVVITTKITEDKEYFHTTADEDIEEMYIVIDDEAPKIYKYDPVNEVWESEPAQTEHTMLQIVLYSFFMQPFDSSWFKETDEGYTLRDNHFYDVFGEIEFDGYEAFNIIIDEDRMTITIAGYDSEGYETTMVFEFYDKGTTTFTLPDFDA